MRTTPLTRRAPLALVVCGALLLAACGGDDAATTTTTADAEATQTIPDSGDEPAEVTRPSTDKPEVQIPDTLPTELVITVLVPGSGPEAVAGDTVLVDYVGVRSEDGTEFDNSYDRGEPFPVTLGIGGVIQGWEDGLTGAQAGSRIQLDIPADLAYGDRGAPPVIEPGDALTFVIDVRVIVPASDPADAPQVEVSESVGATEVGIDDIVVGDGTLVEEGTNVFVQFIVYRGDTLEVLDNTWNAGGPFQFLVAEDELIDGLYEGLLGMQVGGRRIVTIPFEDAWGADGNEGLGLPPSTDLVLVIDVLAAY